MTGILTQNCWGFGKDRKDRFETIADIIKKEDYDIVCLQEVFFNRPWLVFPPWQKVFENIDYYASYQIDWPNWKCGTVLKGGLITLTKEEPQEVKFHRYKAQATKFEQLIDCILGKGFLETTIGNTTILNVHNASSYTEKEWYDPTIERQVGQLLDYIREVNNRGNNIIVAGDFNFVKESPHYEDMICVLEGGLKDITANLGRLNPNNIKLLKKYKKVDYIFTDFGELVEASYLIHNASDHPGVEVILK